MCDIHVVVDEVVIVKPMHAGGEIDWAMIILINISENFQTRRARRVPNVADRLAERGEAYHLLSSNFDHGTKKFVYSNREDETLIRVLRYSDHFSLIRVINHIWFSICVFFYVSFTRRVRAIYVSSIPPELLFVIVLSRYVGNSAKILVDVRDVWPDSVPGIHSRTWKARLFSCYANLVYKFCFRRVDEIVVANPDFEDYVKRYGASSTLVGLGYDSKRFNKKNITGVGLVYIGNLNESFDLRSMKEFLSVAPVLKIIGDGPLAAEYRREFPNADMPGFVDYDDVGGVLASFKYGLLPVTGNATFPNKLFDYYGAGLGVITNDEKAAKLWSLGNYEEINSNIFVIENDKLRKELFDEYSVIADTLCDKLIS